MAEESEIAQPDQRVSASHKPLPSVDMPLLRNERRAARSKQLWVLGLVGASVVVTAAAYRMFSSDDDGSGELGSAELGSAELGESSTTAVAADPELGKVAFVDDGPVPPPAEALPAEPLAIPPTVPPEEVVAGDQERDTPSQPGAVERLSRSFGDARTFRGALERFKISAEQIDALEKSTGDVIDFRRCQPTDRIIVERDASGSVLLFEYHAETTAFVRAKPHKDGFIAQRIEHPVETSRLRRGGIVKSTLGEALVDAGLQRSLVGRFVEAFQRQINFTTQTRDGDSFRIIVDEERVKGEFHRYGTVHAIEYAGQRSGVLRAYWYEPGDSKVGNFYDPGGRSMYGSWLRTPLRYDSLSSPFNPRRMHPVLKRIVPHNGTDYAAGTGTPIWAAAAGTIKFIGNKGANGNLVTIQHANGYETAYAHLSRFEKGLKKGDHVKQMQAIGYVGSTGRSTGPHLHFGLRKRGRWVDPLAVIQGPGELLPPGQRAHYQKLQARLATELEKISVASAQR